MKSIISLVLLVAICGVVIAEEQELTPEQIEAKLRANPIPSIKYVMDKCPERGDRQAWVNEKVVGKYIIVKGVIGGTYLDKPLLGDISYSIGSKLTTVLLDAEPKGVNGGAARLLMNGDAVVVIGKIKAFSVRNYGRDTDVCVTLEGCELLKLVTEKDRKGR